jgi:phytoene dehydrogenase-like protein
LDVRRITSSQNNVAHQNLNIVPYYEEVKMTKKSVIIIGSGIGGLTAGNLLAKKGHKVTIFESHSAPGGYTAGFFKKGFYFESGTLSFEAFPSICKAMEDIGVQDKISFVRQRDRWVSQDFDCMPHSYQDFKDMLYGAYPSEKHKLERYFFEVDQMYDAASLSTGKVIPYLYTGSALLRSMISFAASGRKFMKLFKKYADVTITEFNARFFDRESRIYKLMNFSYPDMAAWIVGGAMATIFDDNWTVRDGMQAWANVLVDNFKESGGQLNLNSYVDKILTENGTAVGVLTKNITYKADYIISASDYKKTFLQLLDDESLVPAELREKIEKAPVSEAFFTVYLGLNISKEELAKHMKTPHVMYFDVESDTNIHNPDDEDFFGKTSFALYSPSMVNPQLAPSGKSSLMLQAMSPSGWMQNWGGRDKQRYKQLKDKVSKTLIKRAEVIVPDLASLIEYQDAATPLTYERYTHNTNGASSAWSWNPKKKFFANTMGVNIETPISNLLIGSCWANQIGGVPGAIMAAYRCSKKIK